MPFQKRKEMRSPSSDLSVLVRGGNAVAPAPHSRSIAPRFPTLLSIEIPTIVTPSCLACPWAWLMCSNLLLNQRCLQEQEPYTRAIFLEGNV